MSLSRRFAVGVAGVSLGNALIAGSYALDGTLLGPITMVALAGAAIGSVGSGVIAYVAYTDPDTFEFGDSRLHQYFPTVFLVGGFATVFAGVMIFVLALVE